jgi:hypothetical protein
MDKDCHVCGCPFLYVKTHGSRTTCFHVRTTPNDYTAGLLYVFTRRAFIVDTHGSRTTCFTCEHCSNRDVSDFINVSEMMLMPTVHSQYQHNGYPGQPYTSPRVRQMNLYARAEMSTLEPQGLEPKWLEPKNGHGRGIWDLYMCNV